MRSSDDMGDIAPALRAAQSEMKAPAFDSVNPHFRNRYASLAAVREAAVPVLCKHGISIHQSVGTGQRGPVVTTLLLHESGQFLESDPLELPATKADPQAWGSAATYAKRYSLLALLCLVAEEDDDGNAASAPAAPVKKTAQNGKAPAAREEPPTPEGKAKDLEAKLVRAGLCRPGELMQHLTDELGPLTPEVEREADELSTQFRRSRPATAAHKQGLLAAMGRAGLDWPALAKLCGWPDGSTLAGLTYGPYRLAMDELAPLAPKES